MNKTAAETRGSLNSGSISLSTGSGDSGDNARSNSSERTDSANVNRRKIPNYLRASTGSCHDICKYGRKLAHEDELKIPLRKRIAKHSLNEDTFIEILVSGKEKKENVDSIKRSLKPSPDANAKAHPRRPNVSSSGKAHSPNLRAEKPPSPETPETITKEVILPQDSIDDKVPSSSSDQKTIDHLLKHPSSVKSKLVKVKSSDVQAGGKVRASAAASKSAAAASVPKSSLSKTASNKARQWGRVKSSPPGKDQHTSKSQVLEKILHVIKTGTGKSSLESTPENNGVPALESPSSPVLLSQVNPSMADEVNGTDEVASGNKTLTMEIEHTILGSSLDSHVTPALPPSSLKSSKHRRTLSSSSIEHTILGSSLNSHATPALPPSSLKSSSHRRTLSATPALPPSSLKSSSHRRTPPSSSSLSKSSFHRRSPSSSSSSSKSSSHRRSPSSSSSSKSSSHSRSPSMSSLEVDEVIKHIVKETDKLVSGERTNVKTSKAQPPKVILNKNPRKINVVNSDDKYSRPVKLKFRSGKILDLHQDNNNNNNIPVRLKFRRIRSDGNKAEVSVSHSKKSLENGNISINSKPLRKTRVVVSEYKRRSPMKLFGSEKGPSLQADNNMPLRLRFRRGRIIGADEGKGDSKRNIRFEGASVKMKLKHQDLIGKKDGQCLFNNVIEETATKLAESRKNKVLALVGAFETVISLHSPRA